ncbi:MAG: type III pantothenate kinase [Muribaculaceae bacterium]|nr:type III pantothenate kinase [Muribaculaceae bacterium]
MALYASIDQGNTATKLTLWLDHEPQRCVVARNASAGSLPEVLASCGRLDGAIYCSVSGRNDTLWQALRGACASAVELDRSTRLPIELHYATPCTLGLDRIAAAAGAVARYPGRRCLVVDIGTAVTYDLAGPDAAFHGGNIAPGAGLRLRALHDFTAALPEVPADGPLPAWGTDTATAMRCGAMRGIAGEISYYRSQLPPDTAVILTGGRADDIAPLLDFPATVDHNLVGRGLISILEHNIDS